MARKPKSAPTKKYTALYWTFFLLSIIITLAPIIYYTIYGFVEGSFQEKLTLGITLIIAVILVAVNLIFKFHLRSSLWILVLGIYFCIDNIMPLLLMVAIGTVLDEVLLTPLYKKFKEKRNINREIDKRIS